eukprot:GHVS01102920.1.p1 GENE.GHVS01102920.1~~GHVS01102920.1.p1  ORF type:complete len:131 (+),score=14.87 GHVS01102920.1:297-689(+)
MKIIATEDALVDLDTTDAPYRSLQRDYYGPSDWSMGKDRYSQCLHRGEHCHSDGAVKCLVGTVTLTGNAAGISSATSVTLSADGLACDQGAIVPRVVSAAGGRLVEGKGDVLLVCQKENIVMLVTIAVAA